MNQLNDYIEYIDHNYLIPTKDIKNLDDLIYNFLNYCDNMEYDIFYTEDAQDEMEDELRVQTNSVHELTEELQREKGK